MDACRTLASGRQVLPLSPRSEPHVLHRPLCRAGGAALGRGKGAPSAEEEIAIFKDVKAVSVAFWDDYLRGDAAAKAFLDSDGLEKESGGRAKLERR